MSDYLMRDGAPFGEEVWAAIDDMVVTVLKKALVARRFVEMVGPLGWGVEQAPRFGFASQEGAQVATETAEYISVTELRQEFILRAKHLALAEQTPFSLDLGAVAIAATRLAKDEDGRIIGALLAEPGGSSGELGDWDALGGPFEAIAAATAKLRSEGFDRPYAVILRPEMYARLASLMQHGRRELDMVEKLADAGIFQSTNMPEEQALVVSPGVWNFDLVVGQDAVTAYVGNEGLDHRFRVFETLALRIKRPGSICVLK